MNTAINSLPIVITTSWDDGYPSDLRLANLLAEYGLAATFYIPRSSQRTTIHEAQVRELSARFEIGAHTLEHLSLTTLNTSQSRLQIADSKSWIESVTGLSCNMFCPPLGKFTQQHVGCIRECGFTGFRTVEMAATELPRRVSGLVELATTIQAHPHCRLAYLKNALRRHQVPATVTAIRHWFNPHWDQRAIKLLDQSLRQQGMFHLWGHSWELDENDQWSTLEALFGRLRKLVSSGQAVTLTNGEVCQRS